MVKLRVSDPWPTISRIAHYSQDLSETTRAQGCPRRSSFPPGSRDLSASSIPDTDRCAQHTSADPALAPVQGCPAGSVTRAQVGQPLLDTRSVSGSSPTSLFYTSLRLCAWIWERLNPNRVTSPPGGGAAGLVRHPAGGLARLAARLVWVSCDRWPPAGDQDEPSGRNRQPGVSGRSAPAIRLLTGRAA